jgi:acyl-CoA reductase-like NAD-dependent aldehyde dehydrogenase
VADVFVQKLAERARRLRVGNGLQQGVDMGPAVDKAQLETDLRYIDIGREEGAALVCGGGRPGGGEYENGYFVEPTVFDGVTNTMKIAREEIFGPVLSVIPFKSIEDGLAQGNDTAYGLAAAVWTRDVSKALKAARAIRAGTVWVNAYNVFDAALPFGGFKESGFGREMGSVGLDHYTEVKTVWVDLGS